jgi:hypothetical protein
MRDIMVDDTTKESGRKVRKKLQDTKSVVQRPMLRGT